MKNDLKYYSNCIIKKYLSTVKYNEMSCLDNEIFTTEKFSGNGKNPYCPRMFRMDDTTYAIERYSFDLGEPINIKEDRVKRMLFTISYEEFERQIDEIIEWLRKTGLNHRDFNPSNLIFYEKEKIIKLIDFYWARTLGITIGEPGQINWYYGQDDAKAAKQIKEQIKVWADKIKETIDKEVNPLINKIGSTIYFDGSSVKQGVVYHPITIPYINSQYVLDCKELAKDIIDNISITPESVIDIGASVGYMTFELIRNFNLTKAYAYEADPHVNAFLKKVKGMYFLNELEILDGVNLDTSFPEVDVSLMLNVHMWLHKQLGREGSDKILSDLIKKSKITFFQTCGSESGGMYVIKDKEFSSKEEIEKHLYSLGAKRVYYIKAEPIHGLYRHLFKIEGRL